MAGKVALSFVNSSALSPVWCLPRAAWFHVVSSGTAWAAFSKREVHCDVAIEPPCAPLSQPVGYAVLHLYLTSMWVLGALPPREQCGHDLEYGPAKTGIQRGFPRGHRHVSNEKCIFVLTFVKRKYLL